MNIIDKAVKNNLCGIATRIENTIIRKEIIRLAEMAGFKIDYNRHYEIDCIYVAGGGWNEVFSSDFEVFKINGNYQKVTLDEMISALTDKVFEIKIGEYEVTNFTKNGFKVGCQTVTWDIFDKIAKLKPKA